MSSFPRGTVIRVRAPTYDEDGDEMTPDSAKLYLSFLGDDGRRRQAAHDMAADGGTMTVRWNSAVAAPGPVEVTYVALDGGSQIVEEDKIIITANRSNPN